MPLRCPHSNLSMRPKSYFCFIFLTHITLNNTEKFSCVYKRSDCAFHNGYYAKNTTASSKMTCLFRNCGCQTRCAITTLGVVHCSVAPLSALLINWLQPLFVPTSESSPGFSFAPKIRISLERPSALWMLDNVYHCRNLGSKGGADLDCVGSTPAWTAMGPVVSSHIRYSHFNADSHIRVQMKHNSRLTLDFWQTFTLALWIKTDSVLKSQPIFDGYKTGFSQTMHFWFYPDQRYLYIRGKKTMTTARNSTNIFQWRHIALLNRNNLRFDMFVDGHQRATSFSAGQIERTAPEVLYLGYRNGDNFFAGSMACIAFYERILTTSEIQALMESCP